MIREDSLPMLEAELASIQQRSVLYTRPGFLIRRLHQIHSGLFLEETSEFNITPVQYSLLSALLEQGELDQISLAMEIGLERTSVAEELPRLETRGLIERRQSPLDGRVKLVRIARKGRSFLARVVWWRDNFVGVAFRAESPSAPVSDLDERLRQSEIKKRQLQRRIEELIGDR